MYTLNLTFNCFGSFKNEMSFKTTRRRTTPYVETGSKETSFCAVTFSEKYSEGQAAQSLLYCSG